MEGLILSSIIHLQPSRVGSTIIRFSFSPRARNSYRNFSSDKINTPTVRERYLIRYYTPGGRMADGGYLFHVWYRLK